MESYGKDDDHDYEEYYSAYSSSHGFIARFLFDVKKWERWIYVALGEKSSQCTLLLFWFIHIFKIK